MYKTFIGSVPTPSTIILGGLSGFLYKLGGSWKQRGLYGATSAGKTRNLTSAKFFFCFKFALV
jgi:hypothetical protein